MDSITVLVIVVIVVLLLLCSSSAMNATSTYGPYGPNGPNGQPITPPSPPKNMIKCPISQYLSRDSAKIGTFSWNLKNNTNTWSNELKQIYGLDPSTNSSDINFMSMVHPDDLPKVRSALQQALQTGQYNATFRMIRPDGKIVTILGCGVIISDETGQPVLATGFDIDITPTSESESEAESEIIYY